MLNTQRQLNVQIRNKHGKGPSRALRREGKIPGILYGQGGDHLAISVDPREFHKALDPIRKLNTYFKLTVSDGQKTHDEDVIIADHQIDVIRNLVTHIDFMRVDPKREIHVRIPVQYSGRAAGVLAGGKQQTFRRDVKIAVCPGDIPVVLDVDVSPINAGETLRIGDVPLDKARFLEDPRQVLVFIEPPKAKKVEEEDPKAAKKGKK